MMEDINMNEQVEFSDLLKKFGTYGFPKNVLDIWDKNAQMI